MRAALGAALRRRGAPAALCAALGRPDEARRWLAGIPEETARARGFAPALSQLRAELEAAGS